MFKYNDVSTDTKFRVLEIKVEPSINYPKQSLRTPIGKEKKMHLVKYLQLLSHLFDIDGMSIVYKVLNLPHLKQLLTPRVFILLCIWINKCNIYVNWLFDSSIIFCSYSQPLFWLCLTDQQCVKDYNLNFVHYVFRFWFFWDCWCSLLGGHILNKKSPIPPFNTLLQSWLSLSGVDS